MGQALDAANRFDRIADIYDETRAPLTEEALDRAAAVLSSDGCKRVLEVGIGTGRIAKPLLQRDFEVTGVDLSRRMMAKATQKGIENLVMGDANNLPFKDKIFDAVVLAHVLHLLERPAETFERLVRVAKNEVVIFIRKRDDPSTSPQSEGLPDLRDAFRKAAEEIGYTFPSRRWDWRERFRNESQFLSTSPPSELITIQDLQVAMTVGERLSLIEKRAHGFPTVAPEADFHKLVERVRSSIDTSKDIHYRRVEQMAIWRLPH